MEKFMDILEIIKAKRKEDNLTQDQMAKLLNMSRITYQKIENNLVTLKIYDFFRIIKILNIPLEAFQDGKYILIQEDDYYDLKNTSEKISKIVKRIESYNID